uniref:Uncharacterized protein n=1 Tax=Rhizophora mucronata TaxID=61149 RepID=A0A2P2NNW1_RHIMU
MHSGFIKDKHFSLTPKKTLFKHYKKENKLSTFSK